MSKFKEGDRVHFVSNPYGYSLHNNNPLIGTQHYRHGTVVGVKDDTEDASYILVYVNWDHIDKYDKTTHMDYREACLDFAPIPITMFTLPDELFTIEV